MLSLEWHVVMCVPGVEKIVVNSTLFRICKRVDFYQSSRHMNCMYMFIEYINNYGIYYEVEFVGFLLVELFPLLRKVPDLNIFTTYNYKSKVHLLF